MDNKHKTELEYIVAIQKSSDINQDELIGILAKILVEGFLYTKTRQVKESKVEPHKKDKKIPPPNVYYY